MGIIRYRRSKMRKTNKYFVWFILFSFLFLFSFPLPSQSKEVKPKEDILEENIGKEAAAEIEE
jgi:hypothetical protein